MNANTFWSDRLEIFLSDSLQGSIKGPLSVLNPLKIYLVASGHKVLGEELTMPPTANVHAQHALLFGKKADAKLVADVDAFLTQGSIQFVKHTAVNDADHIDIHYDLNNVSSLK